MSPQEFEQYVALVIQNLKITDNACVSRNRRFEGKRQSGHYEIDIAVEFRLEGIVDLLLIVECKNWQRPVDRAVIQKLAQTKDAISAHKAAVASPVGFTKEAFEVARDLGIALWVVSFAEAFPRMRTMLYAKSPEQMTTDAKLRSAYDMRRILLSAIRARKEDDIIDYFALVSAAGVTRHDDERSRDVLAQRIRSALVQVSPRADFNVVLAIGCVEFSHHLLGGQFESG